MEGGKTVAGGSYILDRWIFSKVENLILNAEKFLDGYNTVDYCREIRVFIDDLSTWWVRRSRERMKTDHDQKLETLLTLRAVLKKLSSVLAPVMPFVAENIWQQVKENDDPDSVHLSSWVRADQGKINSQLEADMEKARKICELGHSLRSIKKARVRQPLSKIYFNCEFQGEPEEFKNLILSELNIEQFASKQDLVEAQLAKDGELEVAIDFKIDQRLEELGIVREMTRGIQQLRKIRGLKQGELVSVSYSCDDKTKQTIEKNKEKIIALTSLRNLDLNPEIDASQAALEIPALKCFIDIDEDSQDKA